MPVLKCKMCGCDLNITGDEKVVECEYCGSKQTVPNSDENERQTGIYNGAVNAMNAAKTESAFKTAAKAFESIKGFKDADTLAEQCRKDAIYTSAKSKMIGDNAVFYEEAIKTFQTISGWKDSDDQIQLCLKRIEEIKTKEEAFRLEMARRAEEQRIAAEKAAKRRKKVAAIVIPSVAVVIAFVIVLVGVIIPNAKKKAFIEHYGQEVYDTFGLVEEGKTIRFGSYEQDNDTSNGKEKIEWLVLKVEGDKALVISKYALDCQKYYVFDAYMTWERCHLREWLNDSFLNTAFGSQHQELISSVSVSADKNPKYNTKPGNSTNDKVFLLSITEAEKYFSSDSARQCEPTEYAVANRGYVNSDNGNCHWWLRSPGYYQSLAAVVQDDGSVYYFGYGVYAYDVCVRPALWINLGS